MHSPKHTQTSIETNLPFFLSSPPGVMHAYGLQTQTCFVVVSCIPENVCRGFA